MVSLDLAMDVDANKLLSQAGFAVNCRVNYNDRYVDSGRFISAMKGVRVIAAYFHPDDEHHATITTGFGGASAKSIAPAGQWAIAIGTKGIGTTRTYYGSLNE